MRREGNKSRATNNRNLITIRYKTVVSDGEGGFDVTWNSRPNIWAEICAISASQKFEYESLNVEATHRVKIYGNLTFQDNTKYVADIWSQSWTGITGTNVQIDYMIEEGSWTSISASEPNSGSYDWTIPAGAIGRNVIVRIMGIDDPLETSLTDPFNIVAAGTIDGLPDEHDQIDWTINGRTRTFDILTVENMQERDIQVVITCKEYR